jgi:NTE family protein
MNERISILQMTPLFAHQPPKVLEDIAKKLKEEEFMAQERICSTGEIGETMYIVRSGEVKIVVYDQDGKEKVLDYLGRGKYFGEMSLLTGEGRSACVVATLDSKLYVIDRKDFQELISKHPTIGLDLSRVLAERLRRTNNPKPIKKRPPKLIYVISPLSASLQKNLSYLLAKALKKESGRKVIYMDFDFDIPDILQYLKMPEESRKLKEHVKTLESESAQEFEKNLPVHEDISLFIAERETLQQKMTADNYLGVAMGLIKERFDFIVLSIGNPFKKDSAFDSYLHKEFCKICDLILYYLPSLKDVQTANIFLEDNRKIMDKIEIIAQKSDSSEKKYMPKIFQLLKKQPIYRVGVQQEALGEIEDRADVAPDLRRIARRLSGVSVGVAIGAGGMRSCAGIGLLDAFDREDIPVDMVAGSSMGAGVAILYALGKGSKESMEICYKAGNAKFPVNILTFSYLLNPIYAFNKAKELVGENIYLEELEIPVYVIAADLLTSQQVIMDHGLIHDAFAASISIPVLFPPYKYKNMLLVDGGVINELPGDIISEKGAGITVALNVSKVNKDNPEEERRRLQSKNRLVKGLRKIPFLGSYFENPTVASIATRSMFVPNAYLLESKKALFDFFIDPKIAHYGTFETEKIRPVVEAGREEAYKVIPEIKKKIRELKQSQVD